MLKALAALNVVVLIVALVLAVQVINLSGQVDAAANAVTRVRTGGAFGDGTLTIYPTGWDSVPSILSLQQRLDRRMDTLDSEVQNLQAITNRVGRDVLWNTSELGALRSFAPATAAP